MNIGLIGYGYWGPNLARNFNNVDGITLTHICDVRKEYAEKAKNAYPHVKVSTDYAEVVRDSSIDCVAICTPVSSHYHIAKQAMLMGKHIFIEKPFTKEIWQAEQLVETSEKHKLMIMVDHTFIFNESVKKIKELIDSGVVGLPLYYDSIRVNLGIFQQDVNVVWDLAPHDFSIMDYLFNLKPVGVTAVGKGHFNDLENCAYISMHFNENFIAHFNLNWLSPVKVRKTLVGGNRNMIVWDDLEVDEKIKVYNKGVDPPTTEKVHNLLVSYRSGDIYCPKVSNKEALRNEVEYFVHCLESGEKPVNDGNAGLEIVKKLNACDRAMKTGRPVEL